MNKPNRRYDMPDRQADKQTQMNNQWHPDTAEAKIDAALSAYPKTPLPAGFTHRVMTRVAQAPVARPFSGDIWRLSLFDLTLAVFFTAFFASIVFALWWAIALIEGAWFSEWLVAWQASNSELGADAAAEWIVIVSVVACAQAAVAVLLSLLWWDRSLATSPTTHASSVQ